MSNEKRFARGDRVRQKFPGKSIVKERIGTIIGRAQFKGDWLIRWDDDPNPKPRLVPLYERELEPEIDTGSVVGSLE
jgi:hypothetical protein